MSRDGWWGGVGGVLIAKINTLCGLFDGSLTFLKCESISEGVAIAVDTVGSSNTLL